MNRRHVFFCLPLLLLSACVGQHGASPVYVGGGGRAWAKVPTVVLVAPETDPRLQVTREAVDFWNRTFAELGSPFRLGPIVHTTDPVSLADLHRLSVQVVGIRSHRLYPLTLPNVTRNVIAYELGHAIGLGHNDNPTTLMCGRPAPCRPAAFQSRTERFFPLTKAEKARLIAMYPPNWQSR